MGKASRAKRDQRTNLACGARAVTKPQSLAAAAAAAYPASSNGATFYFFVNGIRMSGHEAVIACLVDDESLHLQRLEECVQALGKSCLDLVFTHPITGADVDVLALAVSFTAKGCVEMLTVIAGAQGRGDMLARHLNHLLACVASKFDSKPTTFARAHLKEHFARSRKRGAQNVAALVQHAQAAGFGSAAALLIGEIDAEELADFERRELEVALTPRAKTRSAAKAL